MTEAKRYSEKIISTLEDLLEDEIYDLQTDPGEGCDNDVHTKLVHCVDDTSTYIRELINNMKTLTTQL